jgi:drug/metabolite transporter (DMT)-like permease
VNTSRQRLYGLVSLMTLVWSLNYIVAKYALRAFPPLVIGPLRAVTAAILLVPILLWMKRRQTGPSEPWVFKEVASLCVLGIFGITLNQVLFVVGMNRTSVAHAALMIATTPLQVMLMAAFRGQERISMYKLAGMGTAIGGIAVLNLAPGRTAQGASFFGDAFVFLAAFSFAFYTVFGKELARRHDSMTVNAFGYSAGALTGAPLLLWQSVDFKYTEVPWSGWWALAYMALLSSIACYLIYSYALNHLPASRVAAFSYIQPVVAALAGLLILREPITPGVATGGLLVLSGVWLTGKR